jgi:hypothetical protein
LNLSQTLCVISVVSATLPSFLPRSQQLPDQILDGRFRNRPFWNRPLRYALDDPEREHIETALRIRAGQTHRLRPPTTRASTNRPAAPKNTASWFCFSQPVIPDELGGHDVGSTPPLEVDGPGVAALSAEPENHQDGSISIDRRKSLYSVTSCGVCGK